MMRIQKYLSQSGYCSRRKAEELISAGLVRVNGKITTDLATKIIPERDKISVEGEVIKPSQKLVYLAFNKPYGVTSTLSDDYAETTVTDLVKSQETLKIAGRLDKETEGLMLLSNDGAFIFKVTHPSFSCEKEYIGETYEPIVEKAFEKILKGGTFYDEYYHPCQGKLVRRNRFILILEEGKKRQIRNMFKSIRNQVRSLKRVRIGCVQLDSLKPGKTRPLTREEINYFLHLKKSKKSSKM